MATATLSARLRGDRGKNAARALRREGRVPGVLYGHGDETRTLSLDALELEKLVHSISVENTLIDLQIEGGESTRALIREVQTHPYKPAILHVDFLQIHAGEVVRLEIPVRIVGTPYGVHTEGGVMDQVIYDLEVECLPAHIPEAAEVDVSALRIGESARVRDVGIPNVRILNDPELPICSVVMPTQAAPAEGAEQEPGAGGTMEPELVRRRSAAADQEEA